MSAATPDFTLMQRIRSRLAVAGLQPIAQHYLVAVRAKCPVCGPAGDGGYRPLEIGCYGKDAPRWYCQAGCGKNELDRALVRVLGGQDA